MGMLTAVERPDSAVREDAGDMAAPPPLSRVRRAPARDSIHGLGDEFFLPCGMDGSAWFGPG
jgi:hypothetical protein